MGERVFQLKYRIPTAAEFFDVFSKKLKNSKLPRWDETTPWTKLVLKGMLHEMGEEFGFDPIAEYLDVDQIWNLDVEHQVNTVAVAIEHEASVDDWEEASKNLVPSIFSARTTCSRLVSMLCLLPISLSCGTSSRATTVS